MFPKKSFHTVYNERIHTVIDYIRDHIGEEISLDTLATIACFSPYHFHRIFTAFTGETPRDYIERIRMERAANRLCIMNHHSVSEVAFDCGFSSVSVFSRTFKRFYQIPPSRFFEKHRHDFHSIDQTLAQNNSISHADRFPMPVHIKHFPQMHLAYIQTMEGYAKGIPKAWDKMIRFAQINNFYGNDLMLIGLPLDNPGITPREKCCYRACIPVPKTIVRKQGEVKTFDLDGGAFAVAHFKGRRQDITDAYAFIYGNWLPKSGYIPDEKPLMEIYPLTLFDDCNAEILEYDIALPICEF